MIPGYTPIGIHKDHRDITKFEKHDDPGLLAIVGELRRWIKDLTIPVITPRLAVAYFQEPLQEERGERVVQIEQGQCA